MKTAISFVNTGRPSNTASAAGKLQDLSLYEGMDNNQIEEVLQAFANDEQLLAISGVTEIAPREAQLRQSMCELKARYDRRGARTVLNRSQNSEEDTDGPTNSGPILARSVRVGTSRRILAKISEPKPSASVRDSDEASPEKLTATCS